MNRKSLSPHAAAGAARCATILILSATGALWAQDSPAATSARNGLRIRSVSAYAGYSTNGLPDSGVGSPTVATKLPSDLSEGGGVTIEWTKFTERSTFSFNYTPSYSGRLRYSSLNAFNQASFLTVTRSVTPRLNVGFSLRGDYTSLEQSLFLPNTLSSVAAVPSTFDDLAAGILSARSTTNPQLTSVLSSAPAADSPVRAFLYGQRMFTGSAQASLYYSLSPRLTVSFRGGGNRTQHVSQDQALTALNPYLIPSSTTGSVSAGIAYALSSKTQIGVSVTTMRVSSSLQDIYTTSSLASLGRTLGGRWLAQIHGGVGISKPVRQTLLKVSQKPQPTGGGSLGFKTLSHTLLGAVEQSVSDSYGVGAATSSSVTASWLWRRAGRLWWVGSSAGWQQLHGNLLTDTSGWYASTGLTRLIGRHVAVQTQYAYLHYSGQLQGSAYRRSQSALRASLVWSPHGNPEP